MKKRISAEKKIFVKDLAINIKLSKCILQSRKWNYIYLEDLGFIYTEKCNVKTMNLLLLLDTIFFYCEESQIIVQCNVIILLWGERQTWSREQQLPDTEDFIFGYADTGNISFTEFFKDESILLKMSHDSNYLFLACIFFM